MKKSIVRNFPHMDSQTQRKKKCKISQGHKVLINFNIFSSAMLTGSFQMLIAALFQQYSPFSLTNLQPEKLTYTMGQLNHDGLFIYVVITILDWGEIEIGRKTSIWAPVKRSKKYQFMFYHYSSAMHSNLREILENICQLHQL